MTLRLDVLTEADCERVRTWRNEALATLRTPYPTTAEQQADFYRRVVCDRGSMHRYYAVRRDFSDVDVQPPGDLAAMGGLTFISAENGNAEISLIVAPESRERGVGRGAVELLLEEAFQRLRLETVYGEVYVSNPAAVEFWHAIATRYRGDEVVLPRRKFWAGRLWGSVYFSIAAEHWRAAIASAESAA